MHVVKRPAAANSNAGMARDRAWRVVKGCCFGQEHASTLHNMSIVDGQHDPLEFHTCYTCNPSSSTSPLLSRKKSMNRSCQDAHQSHLIPSKHITSVSGKVDSAGRPATICICICKHSALQTSRWHRTPFAVRERLERACVVLLVVWIRDGACSGFLTCLQ